MEQIMIKAIEEQGEQMAVVGYWPGVLAARWAEIAITEAQQLRPADIFWALKQRLGMGY